MLLGAQHHAPPEILGVWRAKLAPSNQDAFAKGIAKLYVLRIRPDGTWTRTVRSTTKGTWTLVGDALVMRETSNNSGSSFKPRTYRFRYVRSSHRLISERDKGSWLEKSGKQ